MPGAILWTVLEYTCHNRSAVTSSVHEFLLVPREREQDREELKKMIAEVNRTELPPEEVLSDHLYLYCSREREVRIV
jgi:hypothetical protein